MLTTDVERISRRKHELARVIAGRMTVEHAANLSDAEIDRTLAHCVKDLAPVAKQLRDEGFLTCKCGPQPAPQMTFCPACEKLRLQSDSF